MKEQKLLIGSVVLIGVVAYFALRKTSRQMTDKIMELGGSSDEVLERGLVKYRPKSIRFLYKACVEDPELCKRLLPKIREKF